MSRSSIQKSFGESWRNFDAICMTADITKTDESGIAESWILAYEAGILNTLLDRDIIDNN